MTKTRTKTLPSSSQPVNCYECQHHFITHDKNKPYGCHALLVSKAQCYHHGLFLPRLARNVHILR